MFSYKTPAIRNDATPTEAQMKLAIAQTLSQSFAYNAPVIVLDFEVDEEGGMTGRFKDAARPRVFSFEIDGESVSYKPFKPGRMDSEDDVIEWEEFSKGYAYRVDAGAMKSGKKPQCVKPTAYNCGSACININNACKANAKDAIGKQRLNKLRDLALRLVETKDKEKTAAVDKKISEIESARSAKAKSLLEERAIKKGQQAKPKIANKSAQDDPLSKVSPEELKKLADAFSEASKEKGLSDKDRESLQKRAAEYQKRLENTTSKDQLTTKKTQRTVKDINDEIKALGEQRETANEEDTKVLTKKMEDLAQEASSIAQANRQKLLKESAKKKVTDIKLDPPKPVASNSKPRYADLDLETPDTPSRKRKVKKEIDLEPPVSSQKKQTKLSSSQKKSRGT